MIQVFHAPNTRSVRVLWLLEELAVDYEVIKLEFKPEILQAPDYLAVNPLGKLPSMRDGKLVINESGAILEYLLAAYGKGKFEPDNGTEEHGRYLQWFHFAEATLMKPIGDIAQHGFIRPEEKRIPAVLEEAKETALKQLGVVEQALDGHDYILGGQFTAADIMLGYDLMLANMFGLLTDDLPKVKAYFARLSERPAFQKATSI